MYMIALHLIHYPTQQSFITIIMQRSLQPPLGNDFLV